MAFFVRVVFFSSFAVNSGMSVACICTGVRSDAIFCNLHVNMLLTRSLPLLNKDFLSLHSFTSLSLLLLLLIRMIS